MKSQTNAMIHDLSAIHRISQEEYEHIEHSPDDFEVGEHAFFIDKTGKMVVGQVVAVRHDGIKFQVEDKFWKVPAIMLTKL